MQKDNSTGDQKAWLRARARKQLAAPPVVLETHAGFGKLYSRCWSDCETGVAIDKEPARAEFLARQRPTWAVYGGDSERLLRGGVGSHVVVNVLDVDPYGDPWPTRSLRSVVERHGNDLYKRYLECCRELMGEACAPAGYRVSKFSGYYCGHAGQMTHYWTELSRIAA